MRLTQKQHQRWEVVYWSGLYFWISRRAGCTVVWWLLLWLTLGVAEVAAQPNEAIFRNVDAYTMISFVGLRYNPETDTYISSATVTNTSSVPLSRYVYLIITAVSPDSAVVVNATGQSAQQHPFYDLSPLVPSQLAPQGITSPLELEFRNPSQEPLQITASIFMPPWAASSNHPPVLTISGDQTVYTDEILQLSVTADDPDGHQVTLPSSPLPANANFDPSSGIFRFQPDNTQVGTTSVTFTAVDHGAPPLSTSKTEISVLQLTAPSVTLLHPTEGLFTSHARQRVIGTVSDLRLKAVTLHHNGTERTIKAVNGAFATALTLVEGLNTLSVSARNAAGTGTSAEIHVTLDTLPPQVVITTPHAYEVLFEAQVRVAGTIDDTTAEVRVHGQTARVQDGFWEVPAVPLSVGENLLTVTATDLAGHVSQTSLPVIRATGDLQAIVVAPNPVRLAAVRASQQLTVTGMLSDGGTQDLTAATTGTTYASSNSAVATVSPDGLVTAVAQGEATITARHSVFSATVQVLVESNLSLLNFIVILTDDQRWDTLWAMPIVQEKLMARGVTFTNAFVTTPLCCPFRTSFLSGGFYAHNTGVLTNALPNGGVSRFHDEETIATILQGAGYKTALMGKYMNGYLKIAPYIPPGWTKFIGIQGGAGFILLLL
jgi:Sulfatase/Glucodextranase, domain B/Bacterial Ig-like domain (group 2)